MWKRIVELALVGFLLSMIWSLTALSAYADDWDKRTKITVNQPFEIPGTILPAGTYIVKIVDLAAGSGNVGLSAHRDTFFRHLGEIGKGDAIWITTPEGNY